MASRYSRWDGTQEPFGEQLEISELLEEISDDVLSGVGPRRAIRRLMRRGLSGRGAGLDELRRRIAGQRRKLAEMTNLEGPLAGIKDRIDEILELEREVLAADESDEARSKEAFLENLPDSPAPLLKELRDYSFASPDADSFYTNLIQELQRQVLEAYFGQMMGAMKSVTADDVARAREMLGRLNAMIQARDRGEPYDFEDFMEHYGDFFPENPRNLDQLLEALARRMAAMSRLMASLAPSQRYALQELAESVLGDMDLAFEMEMLGQELRFLAPNLPWDQMVLSEGTGATGLGQATDALEQLSDLEELESTIAGQYPGASIEDIDEQKLEQALGREAVQDLKSLKAIEKSLEDAGIVSKERGAIELTARGIRRLGEQALVKVFEVLRQERPGGHADREVGGSSEPTGATRPWRFGESGEISVQRTVFNALTRSQAGREGVRLHPGDFELVEAESRTRTATALLLDLSFSMTLRDHWVAAKRMALALQALIESKYPQDHLYLIGFSDYARRLDLSDLTATGPIERVYGTNMQHAFLIARRLLSEHPRASKQVIMVTDGEPTAHLEERRLRGSLLDAAEGLARLGLSPSAFPPDMFEEPGFEDEPAGPYSSFAWPPTSTTIHKTLAEATRLSSSGVTLNIFMLEEDPGLIAFMDELARRTTGRVFQAAGKDLGNFILRDFVKSR